MWIIADASWPGKPQYGHNSRNPRATPQGFKIRMLLKAGGERTQMAKPAGLLTYGTPPLNSNTKKMEPVFVNFKPDAVRPKMAFIARELPVHWRPAAKALIRDLIKQGIIKEADKVTDYGSRARFLPKDKNNDLRLITDFIGSNNLLLRPVYPFEF